MFNQNNIYVKKSNNHPFILAIKWNSYIGHWTCCIGHENKDVLNKLKNKFGLSNYNFGDEFCLGNNIDYVCFDTLQNQDRNVGPNGEDGWCCYPDRSNAKDIRTKETVFGCLETMIQNVN